METDQPPKPPLPKKKKGHNKSLPIGYPIRIFFITLFTSALLSFGANELFSTYAGYTAIISVIVVIIAIGILFDIVGTAVTAAEDHSLHSMSARKVKGSREAVILFKNADKVANICNDVVGDISGIVSGASGAALVAKLTAENSHESIIIGLTVTALIAALTVGGKAFGKGLAIRSSSQIVFLLGKIVYFFTHIFKKKRKS